MLLNYTQQGAPQQVAGTPDEYEIRFSLNDYPNDGPEPDQGDLDETYDHIRANGVPEYPIGEWEYEEQYIVITTEFGPVILVIWRIKFRPLH